MTTDRDVDVLVAGAGGAGLAAALRAAELGATVAVVEWRDQFRQGNNTSMSTCMIPAGGSRWQAAAGVVDDPDTFLADVVRKTHGTTDPTIARALVDAAPALVAWLADHVGLELDLVTDFIYPGHSVARCHSVPDRSGRSLLAGLLAAVERTPAVQLVVPARLADVALGEDGVEADVTAPDGTVERVRAGALVLATGGFGADPALVRELIPEIAEGLYFGGDGCHGDALRIGRGLGLDVGYLDAYQGHGSVAVPQNVLCTWATVMHGAVIVNGAGERFGDETVGYSEYGRRVLDQPGHEAWLILDGRIDAACRSFRDYQDLLAQGGVRWAEDVDELARTTGLPVAALAATLDRAAAAATGAGADAHGRAAVGGVLAPPYGWVRITGALFHTQGGLLVDGDARVLRAGAAVPGLYAAGGAAAGMSGHGADGYMAGNGLLAALGLGFLAGSHAARAPLPA
jgi:fumarate reductase flavoprotein subunit